MNIHTEMAQSSTYEISAFKQYVRYASAIVIYEFELIIISKTVPIKLQIFD